MGVCVIVLGKSGSGKSTSLRNFERGEVGVLNVLGKPLPFRRRLECADNADYGRVRDAILSGTRRAWVVDDAGYLMQNENFARAREAGFGKFTEMAMHFQEVIRAANLAPSDTITYLLMHPEADADGREKIKSVGKMIDSQFGIEGAVPVLIDCVVQDGRHLFVTRNDGTNLAKAPIDSLPEVMDNDLREVDRLLREYWGLAPLTDDEKSGDSE